MVGQPKTHEGKCDEQVSTGKDIFQRILLYRGGEILLPMKERYEPLVGGREPRVFFNSCCHYFIFEAIKFWIQWALYITAFIITANSFKRQSDLHKNQRILYFSIDTPMLFFGKNMFR